VGKIVKVNIRELTHNFSKYLSDVKDGERLIIMERNKAVAEMIPHNEHMNPPGWKRKIERVKLKNCTVSDLVVKMREEEKF
jgi:antitoxin (DNA-binding transcriptional repressor) of toxin-antitoxin stability system